MNSEFRKDLEEAILTMRKYASDMDERKLSTMDLSIHDSSKFLEASGIVAHALCLGYSLVDIESMITHIENPAELIDVELDSDDSSINVSLNKLNLLDECKYSHYSFNTLDPTVNNSDILLNCQKIWKFVFDWDSRSINHGYDKYYISRNGFVPKISMKAILHSSLNVTVSVAGFKDDEKDSAEEQAWKLFDEYEDKVINNLNTDYSWLVKSGHRTSKEEKEV